MSKHRMMNGDVIPIYSELSSWSINDLENALIEIPGNYCFATGPAFTDQPTRRFNYLDISSHLEALECRFISKHLGFYVTLSELRKICKHRSDCGLPILKMKFEIHMLDTTVHVFDTFRLHIDHMKGEIELLYVT